MNKKHKYNNQITD